MSDDNERRRRQTKKNWRDNPRLGRAGLTRSESIAAIEDSWSGSELSLTELIQLIQGSRHKGYSWWFDSLSLDTVQFRDAPPIGSAHGLINWVELIVSFIKGAIACPSPGTYKRSHQHIQDCAPSCLELV